MRRLFAVALLLIAACGGSPSSVDDFGRISAAFHFDPICRIAAPGCGGGADRGLVLLLETVI